jgi:heme/copper-type cytochrome/quinol oxidase subunit 2
MQHALGLSGEAATMFAIMVALGVAGLAALFMALFWPRRWHMSLRIEVVFAFILTAVVIYGDQNSSATFHAYEADLARIESAGMVPQGAELEAFDRVVTVLAFQWGFIFLEGDGVASRNAMVAKAGEKILFRILANDVIHGFNIPAVKLITEVDPGGVRLVWIRAPETPGKYLIQCVDYCGVGHAQMKAWLVVESEGHSAEEEHNEG